MVAEGVSFVFLETALYVGIFVVGISVVAFFAKKAIDSTKLHMDSRHVAGYRRVEKAEANFAYGGHSISHQAGHSAGHQAGHTSHHRKE